MLAYYRFEMFDAARIEKSVLDLPNFAYRRPFIGFVQGDLLRIYGKALRFLKLESSRQPTVEIW